MADKLKKIGSLLRSYQEEIDSLTRRGRFAESAFLSLYKELYEAPDPQHSLQSAHAQVEKSKSLRLKLLKSQSEIKKLQNDLDEYESEFAKLKNQDITIRELEYKLEEFQKSLEEKIAKAVQQKEGDLAEAADARVARAMREQRVLEGRVVDASADISELKRQLDFAHTTIFELRTAQEEKDAAALAEAQIVTEDEARSAARLDALERENERLRKELSSERSGTGSAAQLAKTSAAKVENAMQQCANLRSDIAHRDDAIETLKDELADMRRQQASAEAHFQAERSAMSARIDCED